MGFGEILKTSMAETYMMRSMMCLLSQLIRRMILNPFALIATLCLGLNGLANSSANADDRVRIVIASSMAEYFRPTVGWVPGEWSPDGIIVLGGDQSDETQLRGLESIPIQQKFGLISMAVSDLADLISGQRSLIILEYTGGRRYDDHSEFARWSSLTDSRGRSAILLAAQPSPSLKILSLSRNFVYLLGVNPELDRQELRRLLEFGLVTREQIYFGSLCAQRLTAKGF